MLDLIRVLQFSDSALPVGAFAFSNGLESAIQNEIVTDSESLHHFIQVILKQTALMDGIALLEGHRAVSQQDYARLTDIDNTFYAYRVGIEQQQMQTKMGRKFAELAAKITQNPIIARWAEDIRSGKTAGCYPCSQAVVFACLNIDEKQAFVSHQYGIASMILNAAVRLMRIDHYATQSILFNLNTTVAEEYAEIREKTLDDICMFAPVYEILNAHHVNAHVHMFMN